MKQIMQYNEIRSWMYRNARNLELSLWKYLFENQSKEAVLNALSIYQNEDGGFGNALEPDNWNPNSTPITTNHALQILRQIDFFDMGHPIYQGIWKYLNSKKDLLTYGWRFTIPSNDNFPRAPWWDYSEEQNEKEYFGVTAELCAFILMYGNTKMEVYEEAVVLSKNLMNQFVEEEAKGDMGIASFVILIETLEKVEDNNYNYGKLYQLLATRIHKSIEHNIKKWEFYTVRPSTYIKRKECRFYEENAEIFGKELDYLLYKKKIEEVWGITWTWFDHMEQYEREFHISENWWKGYRAIEHVSLLSNFGMFQVPEQITKKTEEKIDEFLQNLDKLHTTELGVIRIKKNLSIEVEDVVKWCREEIMHPNATIVRKGKNWYITIRGVTITVNAYSYTIITAHKGK